MSYELFISYSHAGDGKLASALQSSLQRFGRPWYRRRSIHVFRDKTSLSATPSLWSSISKALDGSAFFLLLASPEAARSKWVQQEVAQWKSRKSASALLIGLTDGEVTWDSRSRDFDWSRTTALPANLGETFADEPLYVDLRWVRAAEHVSPRHPRFRDAVADIASAVLGRPKDELIGEDVRQHRRNLAYAWSGAVAITVAGLVAAGMYLVAEEQRARAEREARVALARQLAAQSLGFRERAPQRSLLLALDSVNATRSVDGDWLPVSEEVLRGALARVGGTPRPGHTAEITAARFGNGSRTLVTCSADGTARVHRDPTASDRVRVLEGDGGAIRHCFLDPTDRWLLTIARDRSMTLFDLAADPARAYALRRPPGMEWPPPPAEHGPWARERRPVLFDSAGTLLLAPNGLWSLSSGEPRPVALGDGRHRIVSWDIDPRGRWIATGNADATARLWSRSSPGDLVSTLSGHELWGSVGDETGDVYTARFDPSGRWLLTVSARFVAKLWDLSADPPRGHRLRGYTGGVGPVAFDADGTRIAVAGRESGVSLWDLSSGEPRPVALDGAEGRAALLGFGPRGRWLAIGGLFGNLEVHDVSAGLDAWVREESLDARPVQFSFDARGHFLVAVTESHTAHLVRLRIWGSDARIELRGHEGDAPVRGAAFGPEGPWLATWGEDTAVRLWDASVPYVEPRALWGPGGAIAARQVSPRGRWVLGREWAGGEALLDSFRPGAAPLLLDPDPSAVKGFAFSGDERYLATSHRDGTVRIWDLTRPSPEPRLLPEEREPVSGLALSGDGAWLAGISGKSVLIWPLSESSPVSTVLSSGWHTRAVGVSMDGERVFAGGDGGEVRVWRTADPDTAPDVLAVSDGQVRVLAADVSGRWLATVGTAAGTGKMLRLWDLRAPEAARGTTSTGRDEPAFAFSRDGAWFAAGRGDGVVLLWSLVDGDAEPRELPGPRAPASELVFDPATIRLAAGGRDGSVRVWTLSDLDEVVSLPAREKSAQKLAFSADGSVVATSPPLRLWSLSSEPPRPVLLPTRARALLGFVGPAGTELLTTLDGKSLLWRSVVKELTDLACRQVGRNLDCAEWRQLRGRTNYVPSCPELHEPSPCPQLP